MEEAFEESQGPHRAVESVMMMMMKVKYHGFSSIT
jgi:hypothetical protein